MILPVTVEKLQLPVQKKTRHKNEVESCWFDTKLIINSDEVSCIYVYACRYPGKCCIHGSQTFWCFEAWAKSAQQCLVRAPLGIHPEPINKVNAVSDNIIIINNATGPKQELCSAK